LFFLCGCCYVDFIYGVLVGCLWVLLFFFDCVFFSVLFVFLVFGLFWFILVYESQSKGLHPCNVRTGSIAEQETLSHSDLRLSLRGRGSRIRKTSPGL
jgi:hypothetical protein